MTQGSEERQGGVIPPIQERYDLKSLTTFVPNKTIPIHNWFYFKEGFARDFVKIALNWMGVSSGLILDPFVGVGTTNLVAKELGLRSIGIDVSPLMILISRVKCRNYDIEELAHWVSRIFGTRFSKPNLDIVPDFVRRYFNRYTLEDVIFFRDLVNQVEDIPVREFLLVALMSATMKASYVYKDGSVLRVMKKPVPPFRKFYKARVQKMIRDLKKFNFGGPEPELLVGDARQMKEIGDESIDAIVTSPPYLNKIEYTKVYGIEYALFLPGKEPDPIRSYIGTIVKEESSLSNSLPPVANAYFQDMRKVLCEIMRVLRKGSEATILLAGGVFPDRVVETDVIMAKMASEIGFVVKAIIAMNRRVATRNRVEKIGWARESALIIKKPF